MKKYAKNLGQKIKNKANHVLRPSSRQDIRPSPAPSQHFGSPADIELHQDQALSAPEAHGVADIGIPIAPAVGASAVTSTSHLAPGTISPVITSATASTALPSIQPTARPAVEILLAAQRDGADLFQPLHNALTSVVRMGEQVEARIKLFNNFSLLHYLYFATGKLECQGGTGGAQN